MKITIISACSKNGVIGINNDLPWYLPQDLKRFKQITTGKTVVMGRKTFDSIKSRLGKPLPNRTNVVLTRDKTFSEEGVIFHHSIEEVMENHEEVVVIGGSEIYKLFIHTADTIELTLIDKEFDGDSYFPEMESLLWKESNKESFNNGEFDYHFITYKKNIL